MNSKDVLVNIQTIDKRTRRHLPLRPAGPRYDGDSKTVLGLLKEAVAAEIVNVVGPSHPQLVAAESLLRVVEEDLRGRQLALKRYGDIHDYFGRQNSTTGRMLEVIRALEQDRNCAVRALLEDLRSRLRNTLQGKLN